MEVIVQKEDCRLDKYLANELKLSRNKIQRLIDDKKVFVNEKNVNNSYKLALNDKIIINDDLNYDIKIVKENIPLDIVYEDEYLMIINKPSGMVVHPAPGNYHNTLVNALIDEIPHEKDNIRPGIVHRLDKDTSGLMMVAKTSNMQEVLSKMIKEKEVKRTYLALVEGEINHETGTIDAPIGRDSKYREKMMVKKDNSKEAITHFKVLKRYNNATLIECILDTGRTHQIRVHLAYINHPVVNDPKYGKLINDNTFGQLLHSYKLSFIHPITKKELLFVKEPPKEFYDLLDKYVA